MVLTRGEEQNPLSVQRKGERVRCIVMSFLWKSVSGSVGEDGWAGTFFRVTLWSFEVSCGLLMFLSQYSFLFYQWHFDLKGKKSHRSPQNSRELENYLTVISHKRDICCISTSAFQGHKLRLFSVETTLLFVWEVLCLHTILRFFNYNDQHKSTFTLSFKHLT